MTKRSKPVDLERREKIQNYFWNEVGAVEHISLPKLKDAIKKQFNNENNRFVQEQIGLMQTESRIRVESNVKVWIKRPNKG